MPGDGGWVGVGGGVGTEGGGWGGCWAGTRVGLTGVGRVGAVLVALFDLDEVNNKLCCVMDQRCSLQK